LLACSGQNQKVAAPVNVSVLVLEAVDACRRIAPRNVQFQLDLAHDLPTLQADPGLIQHAIVNLITNAAEAIGEESGRIGLKTGRDEDRGVYLEVSDTGAGMDSATLERIFDPFFSTKFIGRGLGLAVVSGIIRSHGGEIRVTSQPAGGATFRVLLPAGTAPRRGNAASSTAP
jgi:signal transduction histidine kinase